MATMNKKETQRETTVARDQQSVRAVIKQVVAENRPGLARLAPHDGPVEGTKDSPKR